MSKSFNLVTCKAAYKCLFILQDTLDTSQISVKYRKKVFMICRNWMNESFLKVKYSMENFEKCSHFDFETLLDIIGWRKIGMTHDSYPIISIYLE